MQDLETMAISYEAIQSRGFLLVQEQTYLYNCRAQLEMDQRLIGDITRRFPDETQRPEREQEALDLARERVAHYEKELAKFRAA